MKTLLTISTLVFTIMFSSTSFGEWTKVGESENGDTWYVDFDTIRKHEGYVYYWSMRNLLKPNKNGIISGKEYLQGDCKLFGYKYLSISFHKEPMGRGNHTSWSNKIDKEWRYPAPNTVYAESLKSVCSR